MSWLPDSASFHEKVQAAYSVYRGRGLSLSTADVDLVDAWAASGAPFEVVARGLRVGAEALAFDVPAHEPTRIGSLRAFRRPVEAEIKKYLKASAGQGSPSVGRPLQQERHDRLIRLLMKQKPPLAARLKARGPPADFEASEREERLVLGWLWRNLAFADRLACLKESRAAVEAASLVSASARQDSLRYHRAAWVRRKLQIPAFW